MFFKPQLSSQVKWLTAFSFFLMIGTVGILLELNIPDIAAVDFVVISMILVWALSSKIKGYEIQPGKLVVIRLFGRKEIPLADGASVAVDPLAFKHALRKFGISGFFSITGWFSSGRLGNFNAYASSFTSLVTVRTPGQTIVISPDSPEAFVNYFNHRKKAAG